MDLYKKILIDVEDNLREYGFRKSGSSFLTYKNNNWGIINFQESQWKDSTAKKFTINIGVCYTILTDFFQKEIKKNPTILDCQFNMRIGMLLPEKQDFWWLLSPDTYFEVKNNIVGVLRNVVLPIMENYIMDLGIKNYWLQGNSGGQTEFMRYVYLTTILKIYNDQMLDSIVAEMKKYGAKKHIELAVREHLEEIGVTY